ncbi:6129_t:CDS:2, partial [Racocetra fulgida]
GQAALENSRVCLINGTATGCEVLKDLVLPGIGSFTVVDGKEVDGADAGISFFLDGDRIGTNRAQAVTELLQELNEDVRGDYLAEDPISLIENRIDYFLQFTVVISIGVPEKPLLKLSEALWNAKIPLFIVLVETHPENIIDLRLDVPFPALEQYVKPFDFDSMDNMDHGHIPYVVILLKYLDQWKKDVNIDKFTST